MFLILLPAMLVVWLVLPAPLAAQSASLFSHAADGVQRQPLVALQRQTGGLAPSPASLFSGAPRHSFFAPLPERATLKADTDHDRSLPAGPAVVQLRALIAEAEAGAAGYDAYNRGARIAPPQAPTRMTVQQIYDWIDATPGQPHAIGRYQFIPPTLRRLMTQVGADPRARFSPELQDRLADELLAEAGIQTLKRGEMTRRSFMYRLAKIWAGLPLPSGESYYEGYAGNKATMTWARFDGAMARIFPG